MSDYKFYENYGIGILNHRGIFPTGVDDVCKKKVKVEVSSFEYFLLNHFSLKLRKIFIKLFWKLFVFIRKFYIKKYKRDIDLFMDDKIPVNLRSYYFNRIPKKVVIFIKQYDYEYRE